MQRARDAAIPSALDTQELQMRHEAELEELTAAHEAQLSNLAMQADTELDLMKNDCEQ